MRVSALAALLTAALFLFAPLQGNVAHAATSGCVTFNPVPGSGNWRFRNNCRYPLSVAYCVRYSRGNPSKYIGRFKLNRTLTVYLKNISNRIVVRHCRQGSCVPSVPGC